MALYNDLGIHLTFSNLCAFYPALDCHRRNSAFYTELQRFETIAALTELQIASENGVIIPPNIEEGDRRFIQAAASNDDFCEDSKDGKKTTHANTMVLYQSKLSGMFADENYSRPISKTRKQNIKEIDYKDLLKVQFIELSKGVSLPDYNQKEVQNMLVGRLDGQNTCFYQSFYRRYFMDIGQIDT